MRTQLQIGLLVLSLSLSGCGGGGGGGSSGGEPPALSLSPPAMPEEGLMQAWGSSATGVAGASYSWSFGDGASSTLPSPLHRYSAAGPYTVKLTVNYPDGRSSQASASVQVARFALAQGLSCSGSDQRGWCWAGGVQTTRASFDGNGGAALGNELGGIDLSADGGKTWKSRLAPQGADTILALRRDGAELRAITAKGRLWSSADAGASWTSVETGISMAAPTASDYVWVPDFQVSGGGTRLLLAQRASSISPTLFDVSIDSGRSWRRLASDKVSSGGIDYTLKPNAGVFFDSGGQLWVVGYWYEYSPSAAVKRFALLASSNGGATFTPRLSLPALGDAGLNLAVAGSRILAVASARVGSAAVLHQWSSANAGVTWAEGLAEGVGLSDPPGVSLWLDETGDAWLFSRNSGIYKREGDTLAWRRVGTGYADYNCATKRLDPKILALICEDAAYVGTEAGVNWRRIGYSSALDVKLDADRLGWWRSRDLWAQSDGSLALQYNGVLALSVGTEQWSLTAAWPRLQQVVMLDRRNGWAFEANGNLLSTTDGGRQWAIRQPRLVDTTGAPSLSFLDSSRGWLLTENRVLMRTEDGGETWIKPAGSNFNVGYYQFLDANRGLATDPAGNQLFASSDGGKSWTLVGDTGRPTGAGLNGLVFRNPDLGLAFLSQGRLLRTVDGGKRWQLIVGPTNAALARGQFLSDKVVLAIGTGGTVLRSNDAGLTWTSLTIDGLTDVKAVQALPDGSRTWLLGGDGKLFVSSDSGASWRVQPSGTGATALTQMFALDSKSLWLLDQLGRLRLTDSGGD